MKWRHSGTGSTAPICEGQIEGGGNDSGHNGCTEREEAMEAVVARRGRRQWGQRHIESGGGGGGTWSEGGNDVYLHELDGDRMEREKS